MANFTTKQLRKLMEISKEPLFFANTIIKAYKIPRRRLTYLQWKMNPEKRKGRWHHWRIIDLFWFQILTELNKKLSLEDIKPIEKLIEPIFNNLEQFKNLVAGKRVFIILKDKFCYIRPSIDDVSDYINYSDNEVCVILPIRFAFCGWENLLQKGSSVIGLG